MGSNGSLWEYMVLGRSALRTDWKESLCWRERTEARWKILDHLALILLWDSGTCLLKGEPILVVIGRWIAILARLYQIGRNAEAERANRGDGALELRRTQM